MPRKKSVILPPATPSQTISVTLSEGPQTTKSGRDRVSALLHAEGFQRRPDEFWRYAGDPMDLMPNWQVVQAPDGRWVWSQTCA